MANTTQAGSKTVSLMATASFCFQMAATKKVRCVKDNMQTWMKKTSILVMTPKIFEESNMNSMNGNVSQGMT